MSLVLNEDQQLLKQTASEFTKEKLPISHLRGLRDSGDAVGFSRAIWKEMAELGWTGILFPEEYGGADLGMAELGVVLEECGRTLAPTPFQSTVLLGGCAVAIAGNDEQKAKILPGVCSGDTLLALAHQERSHFRPYEIETTAKKSGAGYRLDGEKIFVLDGHIADTLIVAARTSGNNGDRSGISLFLLSPSTKGVSVTQTSMVDSRNAACVKLEGVTLDASDLLGAPGEAADTLDAVFDRATVGLCAEMVGIIDVVFENTIAYLKTREQFGALIGTFQALKHRAATMFCETQLAQAITLDALRAIDEDREGATRIVSAAKARCCDTSSLVTCEGLQMLGGIGMTDEEDIGLFLKRAKVAEISFGDAAYHRDRFAKMTGF